MKELKTIEEFKTFLNSGAEWKNTAVLGLKLTPFTGDLKNLNFHGSIFLGCGLSDEVIVQIIDTGGLYFPDIKGLPYHPYKSSLYTRDTLFAGFDPDNPDSYHNTPDWQIYKHYLENGKDHPGSILESLSRRLHDHSITDALHDFLDLLPDNNRVVSIMGGHRLTRTSPDYKKIVQISHTLACAGYLMVSGGGPGAMEATHLGVWLSGYDMEIIDEAIQLLSVAPTHEDPGWLASAFRVIANFPHIPNKKGQNESVGIPTWLYGHEPATPFASQIAKYFANSVREEGLLAIAKGGVIYAPGSAGTIQEIFQDACQNHYKTFDFASPMVFLNEEYWKWTKPVYPLLAQLAAGREYASLISSSNNVDEIVKTLIEFKPA